MPAPPSRTASLDHAIVCRPLTPGRWTDLTSLFGPRGACGGCWCQYWRVSAGVFEAGKRGANRRRLEQSVMQGPPPGILAYREGSPVGWCAVAPRGDFPRLDRSRILAPIDDRPVWAITCLFVARHERHKGVSGALIRAAVAHARRHGARLVEAYPVDTSTQQADVFVWTGLASAFRRIGFAEVARRSPTRPIMRLAVRA